MSYTDKKHADYELNRYHKRRLEAIELLGGECSVCGSETDLQLDHIDPKQKSFSVSKLWSISKEKYLLELSKCQVLCKSCHNTKTYSKDRIPLDHGDYGFYRHRKCRCTLCKAASAAYYERIQISIGE